MTALYLPQRRANDQPTGSPDRPAEVNPSSARWSKARASRGDNGRCIEVAFLDDGKIAFRDNEDLQDPPFIVSRYVWVCLADGAKGGEFDPS
ncbi:DUF397 domain-containing protein [Streptomyces synnematoformans]|uniref:DUF397 domain-containing protein n=1 Tax=Streptomyces synnematoformans TaxID=415721 RepID=UPI0031DD5FA6